MGRKNNREQDVRKILKKKKNREDFFKKKAENFEQSAKLINFSEERNLRYLLCAVDILSNGNPQIQTMLRENSPSQKLLKKLKQGISQQGSLCPEKKRLAKLVVRAMEKQIDGSTPKREDISKIMDLTTRITNQRIIGLCMIQPSS